MDISWLMVEVTEVDLVAQCLFDSSLPVDEHQGTTEVPPPTPETRTSAHSVQDTQLRHDPRPFLAVHEHKPDEFIHPQGPVRRITKVIKSMYTDLWVTWSDVPIEQRQRMWESFSSVYQWHPQQAGLIRAVFDRTAAERFRESMNKARMEAAARARVLGVEDPSNPENVLRLIPYNPDWISPTLWERLCSGPWNTDAYKRKRSTARKNRLMEIDGSVSKHTGGSISNTVHRDNLRSELGRDPDLLELFTRTHSKKSRSDDSSSSGGDVQWDAYAGKMSQSTQTSGEEAASNVDPFGLWLEVSGGQRKGRTFGAGTSADPRYVLTGESSSNHAGASSSSSQVSELRNQLEEYQSKFTEEQAMRLALEQSVAEMRRVSDEREARKERELAEMRQMMEQFMRNSRNPPSSV